MTLEEHDGRTTMTVLVDPRRCPSTVTCRSGSGMEAGKQDAYDLLEEVAVSLA
jgi:hypothetical protein